MLKRKEGKAGNPVGPARPVQPTEDEIRLGQFARGTLVFFTVYQVPGEVEGTPEYRAYATDGPAGPRLVCHFTPDSETAPVWRARGTATAGAAGSRSRPARSWQTPSPARLLKLRAHWSLPKSRTSSSQTEPFSPRPAPHHTPQKPLMTIDMQ